METQRLTSEHGLAADAWRRIQRSFLRRVSRWDPENIWAVGFGPKVTEGRVVNELAVRFFVHRKQARVAGTRRLPTTAEVRLRNPQRGEYRSLELSTDVEVARPPCCSGVSLAVSQGRATTALVLRWSEQTEASRQFLEPGDSAWRWGLVTVAHVGASARALIARRVVAAGQPERVRGDVILRGRLPGGPDAMLVETDRDWLWLSGLLPDPASAALPVVSQADVLEWIARSAEGYLHSQDAVHRWQFSTYFPEYHIAGLGRLKQVVRFRAEASERRPLRRGTSGSLLTVAGAPAVMQVAAESPAFEVGYGQTLAAILDWLRAGLRAAHLEVVHVI